MWKPSSVVPQHRTRAILVWVAILITAIGYTVWQTTVVIRKRQNPSTKLVVSNQQYQFPVVSVCLENGFGCGSGDDSIDACVASAIAASIAWYGEDGANALFPSQGQEDNCIEFDLSQFKVPDGERETNAGVKAYISMDWISSSNASAETGYSAGVYVFLGDDSSGNLGEEEYTMVPYSRNEISSDDRNYDITAMTIGKTNRKYLSGASITNYPVLTISTTRLVQTKDYDLFLVSSTTSATSAYPSYSTPWEVTEDSAIGTLFMEITQGSYSHTEVEDIEPLEIGALFGNVGGFWELLVLAWGVFFITKSRDTEPTLKGRNFAKVLQRGAINKRKRRKLDSAAAEEAAGHNHARPPDWDSGSDNDSHFPGASDSGASEKGERSRRHRTRYPSRPRRPEAHPLPRRMSFPSEPGSLGTSTTTSSTLVQSRRSSASMAAGAISAVSSTTTSRHWSGPNAATSAANTFNTYDASTAQSRKTVFTVNGGRNSSFSNNPNDGGNGRARTSFFAAPHAAASSRIYPDSDDESPRSATGPAHETNNFVENDLELG